MSDLKPTDFSKMKSRERDFELARLNRKLENKAYKPDFVNFKEWLQDWIDIEAVAAQQNLVGHPRVPGTSEFLSRARALLPDWVDTYKLEIEAQDSPPSVEEAGKRFRQAWEDALVDEYWELHRVPAAEDVEQWLLEWEQIMKKILAIDLSGWQVHDFPQYAKELLPDWDPPIEPGWIGKKFKPGPGPDPSAFDKLIRHFRKQWRKHILNTGHPGEGKDKRRLMEL